MEHIALLIALSNVLIFLVGIALGYKSGKEQERAKWNTDMASRGIKPKTKRPIA